MKYLAATAVVLHALSVLAQTTPLAEPLTIEQAVAAARANHPEIRAARSELAAHQALARKVGRLPNPRAGADLENIGTDDAPQELTGRVSQVIEIGGERAARRREAAALANAAAVDLEIVEQAITSRVRGAFARALAAQSSLEIAKESLGLVTQLADATRERVEAGRTAGIEEVRTRVTLSAERLELDGAEMRLRIALQNLAAAIGTESRFGRLAGDLEQIAGAAGAQRSLAASALMRRSLLAIEQNEARLDFQKARRVPDVDANAGFRTFEDSSEGAFVAGVGIELPIFDRNADAITAARARVEAARAEASATQLRLERDVAAAQAREQAALRRVEALRSEILPAAQEVFDAVSEGFRLGRFSYLEVVEARRTLVTSRRQLIDALEQLVTERTELDRLTGEAR